MFGEQALSNRSLVTKYVGVVLSAKPYQTCLITIQTKQNVLQCVINCLTSFKVLTTTIKHHRTRSNRGYKREFFLSSNNSPLQKRESTGASFLYLLDRKSKHFSWSVHGWKATQPSLRVFSEKLSKWEPCKSCKIPYKPLHFFGLSTQSIQTLYFEWHLKSYHFAIFLLQILLFVVKILKFSWSFIWTS